MWLKRYLTHGNAKREVHLLISCHMSCAKGRCISAQIKKETVAQVHFAYYIRHFLLMMMRPLILSTKHVCLAHSGKKPKVLLNSC